MPITDWYVNLPALPKKSKGPQVPLSVSRSLKSRIGGRVAVRQVTWTITPHPAGPTHAGNLNPGASDATLAAGSAPGTAVSITNEADNKFVNTVDLPQYGADRYTVTATKTVGGQVQLTKDYRTLRRLYYFMHYTNAEGKSLYDALKPELARIFDELGIELKELGKSKLQDQAVTSNDQPLLVNAPALTHKPQQMRLLLVNQFGTTETYAVNLPVAVTAPGAVGDTVSLDAVTNEWVFIINLPPEPLLEAHARRFFTQDVEVSCKLAQYWLHRADFVLDGSDRLPCKVTLITASQVEIRLTDAANNQRLFAHSPAGLAAPKTAYRLDIALEPTRPLGGMSTGPNIGLTQNLSMFYPGPGGAANRASALARVFAHEIAHALGFVAPAAAHGPAHPNHYTDHGGKGPHCHSNAVLNANDATAGIFWSPYAVPHVYMPPAVPPGPLCIMYHKRTAGLNTMEFCADCQQQLRAADLRPAAMRLLNVNWDTAY